MITIRHERSADVPAREVLLEAAFGAARWTKTSERLRAGRLAAEGLSFVASENGRVVGTVRLWNIEAGRGRPALLLGPLAVEQQARDRGIGAALMTHALAEAGRRGHAAVLLVGDAAYYGRLGFTAEQTGALALPGPAEAHRLLARELVPGALAGARGLLQPTGRRRPARVPPRVARRISRTSRQAA